MEKYKIRKTWLVRINGRVFEESKTEERRDEILDILHGMYPDAEISSEIKRTRVRC